MIAELILRVLLEPIVAGLLYWTGYAVVSVASLGRIKVARLRMGERKAWRWRRSVGSEGLWYKSAGGSRVLKADAVCILGGAAWVAAGFLCYWITR